MLLNDGLHKAILFTAYSAGIRVSEVAALKIKDVDSDRMQILVTQAKGKKGQTRNLKPHSSGYSHVSHKKI